jgi:thymidylate synthase (FAD)
MNQIKVELQEVMGDDKAIALSAWTSSFDYQKKQNRIDEDIIRVVNMLADMKHSVPFESVVFRFWIKLPISADRQHMTHRLASHSGMSGRYRTMLNEWQVPPDDIVDILSKIDDIENGFKKDTISSYKNLCSETNDWYQTSVSDFKGFQNDEVITNAEFKRLREFFRGVLPQNNMTERVTVINLRSFSNYIKLRASKYAQPEIRRIAELMLAEVKKSGKCPVALEALERNGWEI